MLQPDTALTRIILGVVLALLLLLLVWRSVRKDRREYGDFKRLTATMDRQRVMKKWFVQSLVTLGGSAVVILLLAWDYVPRMLRQIDDWPALRLFHGWVAADGSPLAGILIGLAIGVVGGSVLLVVLLRRSDEVPMVGDIAALLPRNRGELRFGAALSINAGIVEEALFRLALPTLIFAVAENALAAVLVSVAVFALLHVYQGWAGILGSLVIGAILMLIFLLTGSILWPMLAHALFDLRSLVLIPMVIYGVHHTSAVDA